MSRRRSVDHRRQIWAMPSITRFFHAPIIAPVIWRCEAARDAADASTCLKTKIFWEWRRRHYDISLITAQYHYY